MYYNTKNNRTCTDNCNHCKNTHNHNCDKYDDEDLINFYPCPLMNFLPIMYKCSSNKNWKNSSNALLCPMNSKTNHCNDTNMISELNLDEANCSTYSETNFEDYTPYNYYDDTYYRNCSHKHNKTICPYYW